MATLGEWFFEGADPAWSSTVGGGGVLSSVWAEEGAQSLYYDTVGSAIQNIFDTSETIIVGRFFYRLTTDVSGIPSVMIQATDPQGSIQIQARVGRKFRCIVVGGTASAESSVMALDTSYRIDFMFRSDTGTTSIAYKIDGVDQTGATRVQTSAAMTNFKIGNQGTTSIQYRIDALKLTNQVADYPLGALPVRVPYRNKMPALIAQ